jgi:excinuclease UvrABC nuclease subunit
MLTQKDILLQAKELPIKDRSGAVYFLISQNDIVYIGQSNNYKDRILTHIAEAQKIFDSYSVILEDDLETRFVVEALYITAFEPKYNLCPPSKHHTKRALEMISRGEI